VITDGASSIAAIYTTSRARLAAQGRGFADERGLRDFETRFRLTRTSPERSRGTQTAPSRARWRTDRLRQSAMSSCSPTASRPRELMLGSIASRRSVLAPRLSLQPGPAGCRSDCSSEERSVGAPRNALLQYHMGQYARGLDERCWHRVVHGSTRATWGSYRSWRRHIYIHHYSCSEYWFYTRRHDPLMPRGRRSPRLMRSHLLRPARSGRHQSWSWRLSRQYHQYGRHLVNQRGRLQPGLTARIEGLNHGWRSS